MKEDNFSSGVVEGIVQEGQEHEFENSESSDGLEENLVHD